MMDFRSHGIEDRRGPDQEEFLSPDAYSYPRLIPCSCSKSLDFRSSCPYTHEWHEIYLRQCSNTKQGLPIPAEYCLEVEHMLACSKPCPQERVKPCPV